MKRIYVFGKNKVDGTGEMKDILGGKGAGLAEMMRIGVPVPPGFTISTQVCREFYTKGREIMNDLMEEVKEHMELLGEQVGARFGDPANPLLVSVRSGAKFSMPGMMDTILNLGLNDKTVEGLIRRTRDERFAYDCYRRLIQMFGNVVLGIPKERFEECLAAMKRERGVSKDIELGAEELKALVKRYKEILKEQSKRSFVDDPYEQLRMAIEAVFGSWNNPRAVEYRRQYRIPDDLGTAVNVQAMVFGNIGRNSATGVGFTRNPSSGKKEFYGEYLLNAQGEDVVAGIRTPQPITELRNDMPGIYEQLRKVSSKLESHFKDMQDFEFTVQEGTLYMLQTRIGKRTGHAAIRIAVDMVEEGLISKEDAVMRVDAEQLQQLLHPEFDAEKKKQFRLLTKGLNASPGAAAGRAVFSADTAVEWASRKERVILVREETTPDDIHGMDAAVGILTMTGGMTSHAAVVGRAKGKPAVVGCSAIHVKEDEHVAVVGDASFREGDYISIDGTTGEVFLGDIPLRKSEIEQVLCGEMKAEESQTYGYLTKLLSYADSFRQLGVRANADTPEEARNAIALGAEGIGLTRTEHMFFKGDRINVMKEMIMAETRQKRQEALAKLLPFQVNDFVEIFRTMKGKPVTIRTIDPPLHEFLPKKEDLIEEIANMKASNAPQNEILQKEMLLRRVRELSEFNPMLGHRGCRLGITHPEITEMQASAIFEAAAILVKEGVDVRPEVMIPLVGDVREFIDQKQIVLRVAKEKMEKHGVKFEFSIGTMIEVPRAALTAGEIAREAEFFSFGTNDLTQMTFGFSRDDGEEFLNHYLEKKILLENPFVTIDVEGVGRLIEVAVKEGRATRPTLKVGICGEHGGDARSVKYCHKVGLDYVSCSPFRIPIARLAAAQAALSARIGKAAEAHDTR